MATLKEVGERTLIEHMRPIFRDRSGKTLVGPGDDAAVIGGLSDGRVVATTDAVSVERHKPAKMTWEQFGWTAAAVNFSDLAAMGARPVGLLASMCMPDCMEEGDLLDIASGMDQCCEFCETEVVGGDTKPGPGILSATALGNLEGRRPMVRSGAAPGDIVAVTGSLGNAAAGFLATERGMDEYEDSISSLMVPVPRWEEGIKLSASGAVSSCMDLSDGLGNACRTICARSHVGMDIEWEFLPVGEEVEEICGLCRRDLKDTVVRWGGDYELLFTFDKAKIQNLYDAGLAFSIIGVVTNDSSPHLCDGDQRSEMQDGLY